MARWMLPTRSSSLISIWPMATARHNTCIWGWGEREGGGEWRERERRAVTLNHHLGKDFLTFFIWNLMVALTSSIFCTMLSLWVRRVGNFPALLRPGPNNLGICLIKLSEARKASYRLAVCVCVCVHNRSDIFSYDNHSGPLPK